MATDGDGNGDGERPKVGYRSPPVHSRFKPGQSGNPNGRSPKSRNGRTLIEAELDQKITINENGLPRTLTKREGVYAVIVNGALRGKPKALDLLFKHLDKNPEADPIVFTDVDDKMINDIIGLIKPKGRKRRRKTDKPS